MQSTLIFFVLLFCQYCCRVAAVPLFLCVAQGVLCSPAWQVFPRHSCLHCFPVKLFVSGFPLRVPIPVYRLLIRRSFSGRFCFLKLFHIVPLHIDPPFLTGQRVASFGIVSSRSCSMKKWVSFGLCCFLAWKFQFRISSLGTLENHL